MKCSAFLIAALLSFGLWAEVSENLNNLRIINRLSSNETSTKEGPLSLASPQGEYTLEVERFINGSVALAQAPWEKSPLKLGINLRSGLAVIAKTNLKRKEDAWAFETQNFLLPLTKEGIKKMKVSDSYSYIFDAVISASVGGYGFDGSVGISGGWRFKVLKTTEKEIEIHLSLLTGKNATVSYSQGYASAYDLIGSELEKGIHFIIDLSSPTGTKTYEQIIKGNVSFAQEQARLKNGVRYVSERRMKTYYSELGIKIKTPNIAWFLLKNSKRNSIGFLSESTSEVPTPVDTISATYTETSQLDLATFYHGKNRFFSAAMNPAKDLFMAKDTWDEEYNTGDFLKSLIENFKKTTLLNKYLSIRIPNNQTNTYSGLHFELSYHQKLLKHIISGNIDFKVLKEFAVQALTLDIEEKQKTYAPELFYNLIDIQQSELIKIAYAISSIEEKTLHMKELLKTDKEAFLKSYSSMMKTIYKSPYLYKAWVNYTKRCGQTIDLKIRSSAFKTYLVHEEFKSNGLCTIE